MGKVYAYTRASKDRKADRVAVKGQILFQTRTFNIDAADRAEGEGEEASLSQQQRQLPLLLHASIVLIVLSSANSYSNT